LNAKNNFSRCHVTIIHPKRHILLVDELFF
jgi:hypothetical protein